MTSIVFNVVYTPGSVGCLSLFARSLLDHSSASFRLVSNACLPAEQRHLRRMCEREPRLEYWAIPTLEMMPHGRALNYLQALTRTEHFCFMDSDIFATGPFIEAALHELGERAAIFSAMPLWVKPQESTLPDGFRTLNGSFNRTNTGLCLGGTYFAMYDNARLTDLMQAHGVGFEETAWARIPAPARRDIEGLGMAMSAYDTGKALNLLLTASGARLANIELSTLWHVGGASFQVLYDQAQSTPRGLAARVVRRAGLSRLLPALGGRRPAEPDDDEARFHLAQRSGQRDPVRQYVLKLLECLARGAPLPRQPLTADPAIDHDLSRARDEIIALHARHAARAAHEG